LQQLKAEAKAIDEEIAAKERVLAERRAYLAEVKSSTVAVESSIVETEAVYERICDGHPSSGAPSSVCFTVSSIQGARIPFRYSVG
jgi:hypothetical protein